MDIYAQNIMDHFKNPRNKGNISNPTTEIEEVNASCGDEIKVDLNIEDKKIIDFKFSGVGCAISQAAASILGEYIIGKDIDSILEITKDEIVARLGVDITERRLKCAILGLMAIQNAILKHKESPLRTWTHYVDY